MTFAERWFVGPVAALLWLCGGGYLLTLLDGAL